MWLNLVGAGHMMPVLYRIHALCFQLRRRCHLRLYDTSYDKYFGFANGERWGLGEPLKDSRARKFDPEFAPLLMYENSTDWLHMNVSFLQSDVQYDDPDAKQVPRDPRPPPTPTPVPCAGWFGSPKASSCPLWRLSR